MIQVPMPIGREQDRGRDYERDSGSINFLCSRHWPYSVPMNRSGVFAAAGAKNQQQFFKIPGREKYDLGCTI